MASEKTSSALKSLLSHGMWTAKTKDRIGAWKAAAEAVAEDKAVPDNMVKGICK